MTGKGLVATWVRRFLLEHVVADLNLSRNTQASYRDALALLLPFAAQQQVQPIDQLEIERLAPDVVRRFLAHLEDERHCSVATRNQRLRLESGMVSRVEIHPRPDCPVCSPSGTSARGDSWPMPGRAQ